MKRMKSWLILLSLLTALLVSVTAPSLAGRAHAAVPAASVAHAVPAHPAAIHVATRVATHAAKGRIAFIIHAGIAFFLFHHVYKLYKQGYYHGFHPIRWTKAAAEILLGVHETRKALDSANGSNSTILHILVKPLNVLYAKLGSLRSSISGGNFNPAQFASIDSGVRSFERQSSQSGMPVVESATGL